jgi:hypothetical protein
MALHDEKGLSALEVQYSREITPNALGKPFWVVEGEAVLQQRSTYSGDRDRDAQAFWSQPHRFFIPAFTCPLEPTSLGIIPGPAPDLQPIRRHAEPAAVRQTSRSSRVLLVASAGRKDKLKELDFTSSRPLPACGFTVVKAGKAPPKNSQIKVS